jgi:hypothetical protein
MRHSVGWLTVGAAALLAGCTRADSPSAGSHPETATNAPAPTTTAPSTKGEIDPKADALVRKMSSYLAGLKAFSFDANNVTEVVRDNGEKFQFMASSHVDVVRPNKLKSERRGEKADVSFYYDGKTMTIYGSRAKLYAQAPAPPTLDEAIDCARDRLGVEAPAADLLFSSAYDTLMGDVQSGILIGPATVDGVATQHVAFRAKSVDLQLWIEDSDTPFPRRYVLTTKDVQGEPEFEVSLSNWKTSPTMADETFAFTPPAGSNRTEFITRGAECANLSR